MRKIQMLAGLALAVSVSAFTWLAQPNEKLSISLKDSKVHWVGKKVTGQHEGDIFFKSGEVTLDKGKLKGGSFEIDMNSLTCTDLTNEGMNKKLVGHLKNDDFFAVDKFPTATLKIKSAKAVVGSSMLSDMANDKSIEHDVTADLTIKGKTNPVNFKIYLLNEGKAATAKGKLVFDRSKYDVRYGSKSFFEGLGDRAIYDDVELSFSVKAQAK